MATASKERSYWTTNKNWFRVNENGEYELTNEATPRAVESFKAWSMPRSAKECPFKHLAPAE